MSHDFETTFVSTNPNKNHETRKTIQQFKILFEKDEPIGEISALHKIKSESFKGTVESTILTTIQMYQELFGTDSDQNQTVFNGYDQTFVFPSQQFEVLQSSSDFTEYDAIDHLKIANLYLKILIEVNQLLNEIQKDVSFTQQRRYHELVVPFTNRRTGKPDERIIPLSDFKQKEILNVRRIEIQAIYSQIQLEIQEAANALLTINKSLKFNDVFIDPIFEQTQTPVMIEKEFDDLFVSSGPNQAPALVDQKETEQDMKSAKQTLLEVVQMIDEFVVENNLLLNSIVTSVEDHYRRNQASYDIVVAIPDPNRWLNDLQQFNEFFQTMKTNLI